jgi:hypothetical protein
MPRARSSNARKAALFSGVDETMDRPSTPAWLQRRRSGPPPLPTTPLSQMNCSMVVVGGGGGEELGEGTRAGRWGELRRRQVGRQQGRW